MTTKQQQEALDYFRQHAAAWQGKAQRSGGGSSGSVIEWRNDYVLQVAAERRETRTFLDVGCGTGELVCAMAHRGADALGVDYAPEMIRLASAKAEREGLSSTRFECCSIFDFAIEAASFDVISANGFIEYVSPAELQSFLDLVSIALAPGGSFVVGSRNRLFNLVSMNDFTLQEVDSGALRLLLREAVAWTNADGMVTVQAAECAPLQPPEMEHSATGIGVATRFQYTPFQLIELLQRRGLRALEVYPVNVHGVPPAFKDVNPEIHVGIAKLLQAHARPGTRLLTRASTFMLHAEKGSTG